MQIGTLVYYKSWCHWVPCCGRPRAGVVSSHSPFYPGHRVQHKTPEPISCFRWLKNCSYRLLASCDVSSPGDTQQSLQRWCLAKGKSFCNVCRQVSVILLVWREMDEARVTQPRCEGDCIGVMWDWKEKPTKLVLKSVQLQLCLWKILLLCLSFFC